jgi:transposase
VQRRVGINEENASLEEVRTAKVCAPTQEGFIRFQAVELLYLGYEEEQVAEISNRSVKTIELWKRLFNRSGVDGLSIRSGRGRARCIARERFRKELLPILLDPQQVGETHWTGEKFHGYLREQKEISVGYSTLLRYFEEHDVKLLFPRRWPERQNQEKRAAFINQLKALATQEDVELWFSDETGIEGDPRPRRTWVKKGSRPRVPYLGDHIRENIVGAVQPQTGQFFALVVPHSDREVFQVFLNEFASYTKGATKKVHLVLDNASWHKGATINWHHITPVYLPAYSPDYNPIEVLWRCIKEKFFMNWFAKTPHELHDRICEALRQMIQQPEEIKSIASMSHLVS